MENAKTEGKLCAESRVTYGKALFFRELRHSLEHHHRDII